MLDKYTMPLLNKALLPIGHRLSAAGISANSITIAGFVLSLVGCYLISIEHYSAALATLVIARIGDALDGVVARDSKPTRFGAYLDICSDFVFYAAFVVAFGLANLQQNAKPSLILVLSFVATASTFLAFAIQQAKDETVRLDLPKKGFYYLGGVCEGTETYLIFLAMLLFPHHFPVLAIGFAIACFITALLRTVYAKRTLSERSTEKS